MSGPWSGTLQLDPTPSVLGENRLDLELSDEAGEPVEGAIVKISPWMPAHGHGSADVVAEETEPGHYATDKLYLNMPGQWELRFQVALEEETGRLVASFEVP